MVVKGQRAIKFHGRLTDCRICELREKCLRHPDRTEARQVYFFQGRSEKKPETFTEKMKRKIDSIKGRLIYNRRLGTAEPVIWQYLLHIRVGSIYPSRETKSKHSVVALLCGAQSIEGASIRSGVCVNGAGLR